MQQKIRNNNNNSTDLFINSLKSFNRPLGKGPFVNLSLMFLRLLSLQSCHCKTGFCLNDHKFI